MAGPRHAQWRARCAAGQAARTLRKELQAAGGWQARHAETDTNKIHFCFSFGTGCGTDQLLLCLPVPHPEPLGLAAAGVPGSYSAPAGLVCPGGAAEPAGCGSWRLAVNGTLCAGCPVDFFCDGGSEALPCSPAPRGALQWLVRQRVRWQGVRCVRERLL